MNRIHSYFATFFSVSMFILASGTVKGQVVADRELKTHISPLTQSVSRLIKLEPFTFQYDQEKWKALKLPQGEQFGFIAEDVQKVFPGIVKEEGKFSPAGKNAFKTTSVKSVNLEELVPVLVGAIREQQAEIDRIKQELQDLKAKK